MTPAKSYDIASDQTAQNIARIDAQDETFATPLRDFFTSWGCHVFINRDPKVPVDYHVICGDVGYVKQIFSSNPTPADKRLVVLLDGNEQMQPTFPAPTKIALVDPVSLSVEAVQMLFRFFFTSPKDLLDLRKNPKKHAPLQEAREQKAIAHVEAEGVGDKERISKIIDSVFSPPKPTGKKTKVRFKSIWGLFFLLAFPFVWYGVSLTMGIVSLTYALFMLRSSRIEPVGAASVASRFWIRQGRGILGIVEKPLALVGEEQILRGQERFVSLLFELTDAASGVSNVFLTGRSLATNLLSRAIGSESTGSPAREVNELRIELFSVENTLGRVQSELRAMRQEQSFPFQIGIVAAWSQKGEEALARYRQTITAIDQFMLLYPRISGFAQKQTYLVLLQNSLELRPTGGFIGSIAVITAEEGRITDIQVHDVYTVDGQLKGHVDPPLPIRALLGQEHWYLRDSNWDADFPTSADRAAWFYEKETGTHVDGVIGISTPFIVDLLSVTGPVTLVDYNDRITSQNFYGKSLFYTQSDFFAGSTQKKDFLGSLTRTLLGELTSAKGVNPIGVFRAVTNALSRGDLMFYFASADIESEVREFGWSGTVFSEKGCAGISTATCFFDPLMVVEANLGINKVNYFVDRLLTRAVEIGEDGRVAETITMAVKNSSRGQPEDSGGVYKTYIRFLVPTDSQITEANLDGVTVPRRNPKETKLTTLPYVETNQTVHGYTEIGVALDVPSGANLRLTVGYRRGAGLHFGEGGATYELFTQKQAGVSPAPLQIRFSYPVFWQADPKAASGNTQVTHRQFLAKEGSLEYNTNLSESQTIRAQFVK